MARLFFCPSQFIVLDCSFNLPSPYFCHFCHPAKPIQWFDGQIWTIQVSFVLLDTLRKVFYVSFLHQKIKATPHTKVRMVCCVNINMWVKWCVRKWVKKLVCLVFCAILKSQNQEHICNSTKGFPVLKPKRYM